MYIWVIEIVEFCVINNLHFPQTIYSDQLHVFSTLTILYDI